MSEEIKVSEMQEAKEINDEDIIMIVQEKVNKKAKIKQVKGVGGATGDTLPISSIMSYPKAVAPENWLICDGSAVSRTEYSELFNVIGTFFGAGDGKTTFNLPNIKGKTIVGLDNSDTDFNAIGKVLGEKTHTLTVAEIPSHNHSMGSFNQYNDGTGGSFAESEKVGRTTSGADGSKGINPIFNTGGSKEHNNIQPSFVGCYIIKAKQSAGVVATVIDNLTSASTIDALSAKQGKILNEKINGTVLYENNNGSRDEITLNDSVENYGIIKIFYSNRTDYSSIEMYDANNKEICLTLSFSIEGLNIARTIYRNIKITKTQLKTTTQGYLSMTTTGGIDSNISAAANDIYIHKIIGYK